MSLLNTVCYGSVLSSSLYWLTPTLLGGYPKFIERGFNDNDLPVWLQNSGYDTYYTGKPFNAHNIQNWNKPIPAGWNQTGCNETRDSWRLILPLTKYSSPR